MCADPEKLCGLKNTFLGDESSLGPQTFHMDNIKADQDNVTVDFHYCALVSA